MRKKINESIKFLRFTFLYLKGKIFLLLGLNFFAALLDTVGISLFIPILSGFSKEQANSKLSNFDAVLESIFAKLPFDSGFNTICVLLIAVFSIKGFIVYLIAYYRINLQEVFTQKIRQDLVINTSHKTFEKFNEKSISYFQNLHTTEIDRLSQGFLDYFKTLQFLSMILIYTLASLYVDHIFSSLVFSLAMGFNFIYSIIYLKTKRVSRQISKDSSEYQNNIIEFLNQFRYLKATNTFKLYFNKIKGSIWNLKDRKTKIGRLSAVTAGIREPMMIIIIIVSILLHVNLLNGHVDTIIISLVMFYRALNALTLSQNSWNRYLNIYGSYELISDYMDIGIRDFKVANNIEVFELQTIELKEIDVYHTDFKVLHQVSLEIDAYETIAVVGSSGSGKTTLVDTIAALITPRRGHILVNERPMSEVVDTFRDFVGYVTQNPVVFNDDLYNNITLWDTISENNLLRYRRALELSGLTMLEKEIRLNKNGIIETNGSNLSGGQKQRIAIARELYREVKVLIFDEATSALDGASERHIQETLEALKGTCLVIQIAHRLSTVKNADRIILMDSGSIIQIGTFDELRKSNVIFSDMVKVQSLT